MNPNAVLEELREFYNLWQDGGMTDDAWDEFIDLFDALDNHIISGGRLPREWERRA